MILVEIDGQKREITGSGEAHLRDLLANKPYLLENSDIKLISHPLSFEVNGLPVKVEYSNRRKRMEMVIMALDASIVIKAPFTADRKKMEDWIISNWNWIEVTRRDMLNKIALRQAQSNPDGNASGAIPPMPTQPQEDFLPKPTPRPDLKPNPSGTQAANAPNNLPVEGNPTDATTNIDSEEIDDSKPLLRWSKDGVPVEVIYRNNLKRIKLCIVSPDAHIQIKAPYGTKASEIVNFIEQGWPWYLENYQKALKEEIPMCSYNEGSKIPYLGKNLTLRLMLGKNRSFTLVQGEELIIACNSKAMVPTMVNDWYHQSSEKLLNELIPRWSKVLGVSAPKVEQKFMVNCWGKCYPGQKKIVIHPQLIFHPKECLEFIVVHELCHLIEGNHSPRFYALLDKYLPNWRTLDELINSKYILK